MISFLEVRSEPHETLYPHRITRPFESNIFYTRLGGNGRADDALAECSGNK